MILAVDAGNSRVKWGLHDGQDWLRKGWAAVADAESLGAAWSGVVAPERIVVSNVAGGAMRTELERCLSPWGCKTSWITALSEQCGVRNGYRHPGQLGSDRWAALIAAWKRCGRACVVVNAGTAMTADALNDSGKFLGGLIVPGLTTMRRALASNTAALEMSPGQFADFPVCSADAVYSGALSAMAGAVERMMQALGKETGRTPLCLLSGGDATALCERLSAEAAIVDNLVLDGLIEIAKQ